MLRDEGSVFDLDPYKLKSRIEFTKFDINILTAVNELEMHSSYNLQLLKEKNMTTYQKHIN